MVRTHRHPSSLPGAGWLRERARGERWAGRTSIRNMARIILPLLLALALFGCAKPEFITKQAQHSGDLGAFVLDSVVRHGGQPKNTNNLPTLNGTWRSEWTVANPETPGRQGKRPETLRVHTRLGFREVSNYLAVAFGPPPVSETTKGMTAGFYRQEDIGLSLMFWGNSKNAGEVGVSWWGIPK